MMPGAGLYLPDSSHRNFSPRSKSKDRSTPEPTPTTQYLERIVPKQSHDLDSKSLASRKSSEDVARVFSSLPTVFDFADFASNAKVSSDSEVFINLLQRVRRDVTEASRLYTSKEVTEYFRSWPEKRTWIDTILFDVQCALNDIGIYVETVRVSGDDESSGSLRRKFEWVLSHQKKLISKQNYLTLCHQSLMATVQVMQAAEMNPAWKGPNPDELHEAPLGQWDEVHEAPGAPVPSITLSGVEGVKLEVKSINSLPVELPGSTPDDIPDPQNWDLYAPPRRRSLSVGDPPTSPISTTFTTLDSPISSTLLAPNLPSPTIPIVSTLPSPSPPISSTLPIPSQAENQKVGDLSPISEASPAWSERSSSRFLSKESPSRKKFDRIRPLPTTVIARPLTATGQTRTRAYSDQLQHLEMKARASFDHQSRPMPTVIEKPLERHDTTSTVQFSNAAAVPVTNKRFRPKEVEVRRTPQRAHTLPNELPFVISPGSLMEELSHWILPAGARTSYHSTDTNGSLSSATPGTSAGSSPIAPSTAIFSDTTPIVVTTNLPTTDSIKSPVSTYSLFPSKQNGPSFPSRPPPPLPKDPLRAVKHKPPPLKNVTHSSIEERTTTPKAMGSPVPPTPPPKEFRHSPSRSDSSVPISPAFFRPLSALKSPPTSPLPPTPSQDESSSSIPGPMSRRRRPATNTRKLQGDIKGAVPPNPAPFSPSEPASPLPPPQIVITTSEAVKPDNSSPDTSQVATEFKTRDRRDTASSGDRSRSVSPSPSRPVSTSKPLPVTPFPIAQVPVTAQSKRRVAHARRMENAFAED